MYTLAQCQLWACVCVHVRVCVFVRQKPVNYGNELIYTAL